MRKPIQLDGVVSDVARINLEFQLNPDIEELKRYNQQAVQDACPHDEQQLVLGDHSADYNLCLNRACGKMLPPSRSQAKNMVGP